LKFFLGNTIVDRRCCDGVKLNGIMIVGKEVEGKKKLRGISHRQESLSESIKNDVFCPKMLQKNYSNARIETLTQISNPQDFHSLEARHASCSALRNVQFRQVPPSPSRVVCALLVPDSGRSKLYVEQHGSCTCYIKA